MNSKFDNLLLREKRLNLKPPKITKHAPSIVRAHSALVGRNMRLWMKNANFAAACAFLSMACIQAFIFLCYYRHWTYTSVTRVQNMHLEVLLRYPIWPLALLLSILPGALHLTLARQPAMFEEYIIDVCVFANNTFRWCQYCFTESIALLLTAHIAGITELWMLAALFMASALAMVMLGFSELENQPSAARRNKGLTDWRMFGFSCVTIAWVWGMLLQYAYTVNSIPRRLLIVAMVASNVCVLLIVAGRYTAYPAFLRRNFPYETSFIALDVITKALLSWSVILEMALKKPLYFLLQSLFHEKHCRESQCRACHVSGNSHMAHVHGARHDANKKACHARPTFIVRPLFRQKKPCDPQAHAHANERHEPSECCV